MSCKKRKGTGGKGKKPYYLTMNYYPDPEETIH